MKNSLTLPRFWAFAVLIATMAGTQLLGQPPGRGGSPKPAFEFVLELSNGDARTIIGGFKSLSGMDSETEVVEFLEGGDSGVIRKLPGRTKYSNIVLKRGIIDSAQNDLWNWRKNIIDGVPDRRDGAIILMRRDGSEVLRYEFFEAFPVVWRGFSLDAGGSDVAVEEIALAVERIERIQ
jgi:phage tail-like protein